MLTVEEELIDRITATFHHLRIGRVPPPIAIPDDLPENEIHQLLIYINRFLVDFAPFAEAMEQLTGRPNRSLQVIWNSGLTLWETSPLLSTA